MEDLRKFVEGLSSEEFKTFSEEFKTFKDELIKATKRNCKRYRAVIQTHHFTGETRLFFKYKGNICKVVRPDQKPIPVGYNSLSSVLYLLKNADAVYMDEQVMWAGKPMDWQPN
jgi:hypothetical protein